MDDQSSSHENTPHVQEVRDFIPLSDVEGRLHDFMPRGWIRGTLHGVEGWMLDVGFSLPNMTGCPPGGQVPASSSQGPPGLFGQAQPANVPFPQANFPRGMGQGKLKIPTFSNKVEDWNLFKSKCSLYKAQLAMQGQEFYAGMNISVSYTHLTLPTKA